MADWSSSQYLKFKNQRTQPAVDLAMRVVEKRPKTVVDIGCGPGNSTAVLRRIFPDAELLGIDSSPDMIERARREHPDLQFRLCDARALEGQYDLLFSNACLQWIPDHASLIPALMDKLRECIFRPSESKETVGVSPPSREKQVQVHGRESTGVLFGKKWQRNASQSAPPRVIYSDWNPFLLRMESSPSMRIL